MRAHLTLPPTPLRQRCWTELLRSKVVHEPLFETAPSLAGLRQGAPERRPRTIFVGVGLCASGVLSRAVPLDLLGMLLPAEIARRALDAEELLVLVADRHALENGFAEDEVRARADAVEAALGWIRRACRLPRLRVVRASAFHSGRAYRQVFARVQRQSPEVHDYVRRQFADIIHLERSHGPLLKVGWALPSTDPARDRDERGLDEAMRKSLRVQLPTLYCKPARTLCDEAPRMPPYVVKRPEARLCLEEGEDVAEKLRAAPAWASADTVAGFRRHLRRLVYTWCRVVGPLPHGPLEERVDAMIRRVYGLGARSGGTS